MYILHCNIQLQEGEDLWRMTIPAHKVDYMIVCMWPTFKKNTEGVGKDL